MNDICAVVLTRNRKELLCDCLDSILNQKDAKCDVIVIDNSSEDGTTDLFDSRYDLESIFYYNTGANLGSAGGFSIGIKKAVEAGYNYVWIMDDDVIPDEDALYQFIVADKELNGDWGCLSSYAYWKDGTICKANRQKKGLFTFCDKNDYRKDYISVKVVSFASMFIKSSVVEDVGLPLAEYYIYTDDYEFSMRISKKYNVYVVTKSKVLHAMKVNSKVDFVNETQDRLYRFKYLYRNDIHCYRSQGWRGVFYICIKICYTILRLLVFEKEDKKGKLSVLASGIKDGVAFCPRIEKVHYEATDW